MLFVRGAFGISNSNSLAASCKASVLHKQKLKGQLILTKQNINDKHEHSQLQVWQQ